MPTELHWACSSSLCPLIHCLLKDILDFLVQYFYLTAWLRVIWSDNPVINSNFHESFLECPINEVWPSITDDYSWESIPWEDDFVKHPLWVHSVGGSTRKSFYLLGDIVDCYQNVLVSIRVREWSHEIDTPDIKDVDLEVWSQQHCIPCIDIPMLLTSATASNKWLGIIIHGWPIETTLPHLSIGAESYIVPSIWWWMTMLKYFLCLKSWYASC
jgi:hypothetical protein